MLRIKAFQGLRPAPALVSEVACVPYDVVDREESAALAAGKPHSLLHVDRAEIDLPPDTDPYSDLVYAKALENFLALQKDGALIRETEPCIYLYQQRLEVFRRRPAPVQLTWLGFPGTTGLDCFAARITDAWADPPGLTDADFTESLARLASGFLAYQPITAPPTHALLPPRSGSGNVTFGCFNNAAKIGRSALGLWAKTLAAVPNSRLVLKAHQLEDPLVADDLRRLARAAGIPPAKVELLPPVAAYTQHLQAYDGIDIALDTFPYHGTTTSCEALLMGVPVVTLAGTTHASRVGVSLLTRLGRPEFIAHDEAEFVAICRALAADVPGLEALRRGLRDELMRSALCDAAPITRDLEALFRSLSYRSGALNP